MTIRLNGSTSGYVELDAPAVAGTSSLTLPSGVGSLLTAEGGKILQIVRATDTTQRSTTSTSFVDVTGMTVTITPQKSNSAILVVSSFLQDNLRTAGSATRASYALTDSSDNPLSGSQQVDSVLTVDGLSPTNYGIRTQILMIGYSTPATTSSVTYKLRFQVGVSTTTARVSNGIATGQMYAIEVSA
jgi:hypothetical protein